MTGRLLDELSREGLWVRPYRTGGRGLENVITAEVPTALDVLPRRAFLGAVLVAALGAGKTSAPSGSAVSAGQRRQCG